MTDRHRGYIVTLEKDIREDDAEDTITALRSIRGVASVQPVVADHGAIMAYEQARMDLVNKLWEVLKPKWCRD